MSPDVLIARGRSSLDHLSADLSLSIAAFASHSHTPPLSNLSLSNFPSQVSHSHTSSLNSLTLTLSFSTLSLSHTSPLKSLTLTHIPAQISHRLPLSRPSLTHASFHKSITLPHFPSQISHSHTHPGSNLSQTSPL